MAYAPGLYLYVNYRGDKERNHFVTFTDDSCKVFREDLLYLKFHPPKSTNIWLYNRGCMVAHWPDVSEDKQAILYNNLRGKINAAVEDRSELDKLDITFISLKELDSRGWKLLANTNDSPRPAKRRRYESERSPSPQRHYPPQQTRQQKIEELRTTLFRARTNIPTLFAQDRSYLNDLHKLGANDIPAPMRLVDEAAEAATQAELSELRKRMQVLEDVARTQLSLKARLEETTKKLQEEELARQTLQVEAREHAASMMRANQQLDVLQKRADGEQVSRAGAEAKHAEARRMVDTLENAYKSLRQEKDDLGERYAKSKINAARYRTDAEGFVRDLDKMTRELDEAKQELREEKDRRKGFYERLGNAQQSEDALKQRCQFLERQMATLAKEREVEGHAARFAKQRDEEALRGAAEKSRTQQLVLKQAEGAMRAAQESERAMKSRVEELERGLELERRLRQEAQGAIEDVRRECNEPFVVPSLLDAFIELARLTTAATVAGPGAPEKTTVSGGSLAGASTATTSVSEQLDVPMQPVKLEQHSPIWR